MSKHDWLILGGCPRSGTTLMTHLLNSHKEVFLTNEQNLGYVMHTIIPMFKREDKVSGAIEREKGKKENWSKKDIMINTFKKDISLIPALEALYLSNYQLDQNNDYIFGDKTPQYWKSFYKPVQAYLPHKVIHITRHPYDVINSYFRRSANTKKGTDYWTKGDSVEEVCNDWIDAWNFINTKKDDPNFCHIKYEDLIFNTEKALKEVSNFLKVKNEFNTDLIIKDHHFERDYLKEEDLKEIDRRLDEISLNWDLPLEDLISQWKVLKKVKAKSKVTFLNKTRCYIKYQLKKIIS